jgi:cytochrome oxidase assembly protein ShyY1
VYRFLLAPRWLALHLALVVVLVAFIALGIWQWRSAEAPRHSASDRRPVPLSSVAQPGQPPPDSALGKVVTLSGEYDGAHQLLVPGREQDGQDGYFVLTPLVATDGTTVPVTRGWVAAPDDNALTVPEGTVTVTGRLLPSESFRNPRLDPRKALPDDQVALISTQSLLDRWPYPSDRLLDGYVLLSEQQPDSAGAPEPVPPPAPGGVAPWRNFSYAVQWWLFAGAAVFFWLSFVRHGVADRRTASSPSQTDAEALSS